MPVFSTISVVKEYLQCYYVDNYFISQTFYLRKSKMHKNKGQDSNSVNLTRLNITDLIIFFCIDFIAMAGAILIAVFIRLYLLPLLWPYYETIKLPPGVLTNLWWLPLIVIVFMVYEGLYTSRLPYWREFEKIITALSLSYLIILALVYLLRIYDEVSRTVIIISFLAAIFFVPTLRYIARSYLHRFAFWRRRILIIGTGQTAVAVARAIINEPYLGYEVAGFITANHSGSEFTVNPGQSFPLHGSTEQSQEIVEREQADIVIIAASEKETGQSMVELANKLHNRAKSLILIPDLVGIPVIGIEADYFFNEQLISLRIRNNLARPEKLLLKRCFDLVAGTLIFLILLPLLFAVAAVVKLDSKGGAIFRQERVGFKENRFNCLKFRTMYSNAESILQKLLSEDPALNKEWQQNFKLQNDPRITTVGKILRSTSIDELPQLINVIKGEMSLVGPRPRPIYELEEAADNPFFQAGLEVKPGLTGLWQVSGRSELDFSNRIFLDSWYVRNWSFWLDISILLRTFLVLFRKKGAY